ncbi:hypothetical protein FAEPRAM212_01705 [Faecalibacterium prausnitzii M21/2]|uniref:Uncharacterized protein n=1 Tax=Faecalibacterium prausnitzii M21/2 TaxID=411485 RepID=A8SBL8_9FIRM|nr:hypothetical protein FAEPRAM212_01705 [Faecalibacterium prausnitzii M21/2]
MALLNSRIASGDSMVARFEENNNLEFEVVQNRPKYY